MSIRIAHITDTHLGMKQYGLPEREQDFTNAFINAFEQILKLKPDLIVHTGDLFDYSHPPTRSIKTAMEVFQKVTRKKIPIFIVPGNHDLPKTADMSESPTSLLSYIDGVYDFSLFGKQNYTIAHKANGETLTIVGVPLSIDPVEMRNYIKKLKAPKGASILLFHAGIKEVFPEFEISLKDLPPGFSYYGIGNLHNKHEYKHHITGAPICFPGSIEMTDFDENSKEKGFFLIDIDGKKVSTEFITLLPQRKFVNLPPIDCTKKNPEVVVSEAIVTIKKNTKAGDVARLNLTGKMAFGKIASINLVEIEKYAYSDAKLLYLDYNNQIEPLELKGQVLSEIRIEPPEKEIMKFLNELPDITKPQRQRYLKLAMNYINKVEESQR